MTDDFFAVQEHDPLSQEITAIGEEGRSGILEVSGEAVVARLHFRTGALVHADRVAGSDTWPLGDYLVYSGILQSRDIMKAIKRAEAKNLLVEEVLLGAKGVTEDVLSRFANLQLEEIAFPLFRLQEPIFRWLDERPHVPRFVTPLPCEWVLKESRRRRDLWPRIRAAVGQPDAIYDRDATLLAELLGYSHDREDPLPSIGGNARVVYFYTNGSRTVVQVARVSGLGLFQVYQALNELIELEVMELVVPSGKGEEPTIFRPYIRTAILGLSYAILAFLMFLAVQWVIHHGDELRQHLLARHTENLDAIVELRRARIQEALNLHQLEFGHYPPTVEELVDAEYSLGSDRDILEGFHLQLEAPGYRLTAVPDHRAERN